MGRFLRLTLLSILASSGLASTAHAGGEIQLYRRIDGRDLAVPELPPASGVGNPVLAVMVSLVDEDLHGRVSQSRLRRAAEEGGDEQIPWQTVLWLERSHPPQEHPRITVRFLSELHVPVPYAVLGYHPGRVGLPHTLVLDEWPQGHWSLWYPEDGRHEWFAVDDLTLFGVREGSIEIDVDGWLDWLMGAKLDDIRITGMALFTHEERRYALAFGYNPEGKGRTGVLDLGDDRILFPPPPAFRAVGRALRGWVERLQARERARSEAEGALEP